MASPADTLDRLLAEADAVIARLKPLVPANAPVAMLAPDTDPFELREHLASAWFRKVDALGAAGRHAEALAAAQALTDHFDPGAAGAASNLAAFASGDGPAATALLAEPQAWPWLARAACAQAIGLAALGRGDEALHRLAAVQQRFARTEALAVREWLAACGLEDARLRAARGATFARVDMVRRCQELVDTFGRDDWPATRAVVGRVRLFRALLLSQLDYVADALDAYAALQAEGQASGDARLQAIAAEALLATARLLESLGRGDEARAAQDTLVSLFATTADDAARRAVAAAHADRLQWLVAQGDQGLEDEAGDIDGEGEGDSEGAPRPMPRTPAEDRVIAACDALIAAHAASTDAPVLVHLNEALRHKAGALRDRAAQRADDFAAEAASDLAEAQAVATAQWAAYGGHADVGVREEAVRAQLDQLASLDVPQVELAGYDEVLAQVGDATEPALQPAIVRAMQLKAWAERALGREAEALATLAALHDRFAASDDIAVQSGVLTAGLQRARLLRDAGRADEALQVLSALEGIDIDRHGPHVRTAHLRLLVAQAMDLQADVWAAQAPPRRVRQGEEAEEEPADGAGPPTTPAEAGHAAAVQALVARFAADTDAAVRRVAADACYLLAVAQRERLHFDAAVASYDLYLRHFEADTAPAILERTASAWLNKAYIVMELLDRPADALPVYDALIARFATATGASMRDTLARAAASRLTCLNRLQRAGVAVSYGDQYEDLPLDKRDAIQATISRGIDLAEAGKHREAIACYDEVLQAHVESLHPELRRQCLDAMVRKVYSLGRLAQREEALALSNELVARYGDDLSTSFEKDVALALSYQAVQLDRLGRRDEEIGVYRHIIDRWRQSTLPALRLRVANARYGLAMTLSDTDLEAALALYQEVMDGCLGQAEASLRTEGAKSAVNRAFRLRSAGRHAEAAACAETLLAACSHETEPAIVAQVTKARVGLVKSYAALGKTHEQAAVLDALLALPDTAITPEQRATARAELAALRAAEAPLVLAVRRLGAWLGQRKG